MNKFYQNNLNSTNLVYSNLLDNINSLKPNKNSQKFALSENFFTPSFTSRSVSKEGMKKITAFLSPLFKIIHRTFSNFIHSLNLRGFFCSLIKKTNDNASSSLKKTNNSLQVVKKIQRKAKNSPSYYFK